MRKFLICFICCLMSSGIRTVMAYEDSGSFSLYSNNTLAEDNSADKVAPENAPVDGGALVLISMATIYALRVYRKRNKETIEP